MLLRHAAPSTPNGCFLLRESGIKKILGICCILVLVEVRSKVTAFIRRVMCTRETKRAIRDTVSRFKPISNAVNAVR
jgi:hypothetical protein